nr:YdcF family protein [Clostridia bacterium]
YLVGLGISADRIEVETQSMDTEENIKNALEIIEHNEGSVSNLRIGIITNGFHVFRGVHITKRLTDAEVCGIAAYMQPQYIPNNMVRETFGILRDFIAGRLEL